MVLFFWDDIQYQNFNYMEKDKKKPGPKDRSYVNKSQDHEVKYEPKRKTPAKKFGSGSTGK
jgi:hypothetical protein